MILVQEICWLLVVTELVIYGTQRIVCVDPVNLSSSTSYELQLRRISYTHLHNYPNFTRNNHHCFIVLAVDCTTPVYRP